MASNNVVVNAIMAATGDARLQAAMLMGSKLESGWNPSSVGDQGTSFGPFQIHLPAHPGVTAAEAENPSWAVNYMMPAYEAGVAKVSDALWQSDPAQAAATAAYYAERPAKMYSGYAGLWSAVQAAMNGQSVATGGGSTTGGATTASVTSSVLGPIESDVSTALNDAYMGFLMLLGIVMMGIGLYLLFKSTISGKAPTVNVSIPKGSSDGSNSGGGRDSSPDTSTTKPPTDTSPAARSGRSSRGSGGTRTAGGLNTGRAVSRTAVGHSVSVTAGRPKPRKVVRVGEGAKS